MVCKLVTGSQVTGSQVTGSQVTGSQVTGSQVTGSQVTGSQVTGSQVYPEGMPLAKGRLRRGQVYFPAGHSNPCHAVQRNPSESLSKRDQCSSV
jgi:hypothetical protein